MILFVFMFFGFMIWGAKGNDNKTTLLATINSLNSENVDKIVIEPQNLDWEINLTGKTIYISDKDKIDRILNALKSSNRIHRGKFIESNWECKLVISFKYPEKIQLKNKEELVLEIENTSKGQIFQLPNVSEFQHYATNDLKEILETEADFRRPLGRKRL